MDSECRKRTAKWRDMEDLAEESRCSFYENFQERADTFKFPRGIYTLDDLKELGTEEHMCPYFLAR